MKRLFLTTLAAFGLALAAPFAAAGQDTDYDWWDGWESEGWSEWGYDDEQWGYEEDEWDETGWSDDDSYYEDDSGYYDESDDFGYYDETYDWSIGDEDEDEFDSWYEEEEEGSF